MLLMVMSAVATERSPVALGWDALRPNLTFRQAAVVLEPVAGPPLIATRSARGQYETWIYDDGGSLLFVQGHLNFWSVPRNVRHIVIAPEPDHAPPSDTDTAVPPPAARSQPSMTLPSLPSMLPSLQDVKVGH